MTAKTLKIVSATRFPQQNEQDHLKFKPGVNLIVGDLNSGKTKWIQMLDFALGDGGTPEKAFNVALAEKYDSVTVRINIDGVDHTIERRWKEKNAKTKIFLDGAAITHEEFSVFMLESLNIPRIERPSGDPYDREWIELSWRELFRHMYKWERPWDGFAERQPPATRSACILNFMQSAQQKFLESFGALVRKRKDLARLKAQRDLFADILQDVALEISRHREMTVAVTPESIQQTRQRLKDQVSQMDSRRAEILSAQDQGIRRKNPEFDAIRQRLSVVYQRQGELEREKNDSLKRRAELDAYIASLRTELSRFDRIKEGVAIFADLKVTHCPACDQEVKPQRFAPALCQVCGQHHLMQDSEGHQSAARRVAFEEQQIHEEIAELEDFVENLDQATREIIDRISEAEREITRETSLIERATTLAERAIPPELAIIDQERGKIDSELEQLDRIEQSLNRRTEMNTTIAALEDEVALLEAEAAANRSGVNYEELSTLLTDRMNDYLNAMHADELAQWQFGRIKVKLDDRDLKVELGNEDWTKKAGGSVQYIVQLAYHYALLSLTKNGIYNYPGFLIIDFPPQFASAKDIGASENYLIEPFVSLCADPKMSGAQVIIAGRAFHNLQGANVIHLGKSFE